MDDAWPSSGVHANQPLAFPIEATRHVHDCAVSFRFMNDVKRFYDCRIHRPFRLTLRVTAPVVSCPCVVRASSRSSVPVSGLARANGAASVPCGGTVDDLGRTYGTARPRDAQSRIWAPATTVVRVTI